MYMYNRYQLAQLFIRGNKKQISQTNCIGSR